MGNQKGQSLVEILVGLGVISIMVGASTYALVTVLRSSTITEQSQSAGLIGNSLLESVSALSESNWNAVYNLQKTLSNHYFLVKSPTTTPTAIFGDESVLEQDIIYGLVGHWKLDEILGTTAYDSSGSGNFGSLINIGDINSGLVGHWKFDEGSGNTATDFSGNSYNGTLYNSPTREETKDCKWGGCLSFDGTDDYVLSPDISNGFDVNYITISGWMYKSSNAADHHTVLSRNGNSFIINFYGNAFEIYFYTTGGTCYNSGVSYVPYLNGWHHFTATFNGSESSLYMDGALVKTQTGCSGVLNASSEGVYIGARGPSSGRIAAKLDDVRIYNRALAASEILRLYNMNSCRVGNCLVFDGVNDYINISDSNSLKINGDLTISAWIKPLSLASQRQVLVDKGYNSEFRLGFINNVSPYPIYAMHGDGVGNYYQTSIINSLTQNEWQHIVIVRDNTVKQYRGYKNGVLNLTSGIYTINPTVTTHAVSIGRRIEGSEYFNGLMDDIRIYNRALSDNEITQLYNSPVYSRYFYVDNVNRTVCGTGIVTTDPESDCLGTSGVSEDPATQKIIVGTAWSLKGANEILENSIFVSRWINSVTEQSDWGGNDGVSSEVSSFGDDYSEYSNISTTTSGAIKILGIE